MLSAVPLSAAYCQSCLALHRVQLFVFHTPLMQIEADSHYLGSRKGWEVELM